MNTCLCADPVCRLLGCKAQQQRLGAGFFKEPKYNTAQQEPADDGKTYPAPRPLTEADVRRIVREEMQKAFK